MYKENRYTGTTTTGHLIEEEDRHEMYGLYFRVVITEQLDRMYPCFQVYMFQKGIATWFVRMHVESQDYSKGPSEDEKSAKITRTNSQPRLDLRRALSDLSRHLLLHLQSVDLTVSVIPHTS